MSSSKKNTINILSSYFDQILKLAYFLVLTILFARFMGPEEFGVLNIYISAISVFFGISKFGLDTILVNSIITHKNKNIINHIFFIKLLTLISLLFSFFFIFMQVETQKIITYVLALFFICFKTYDQFEIWFKAREKIKLIAFSRLIAILLSVTCIYIYLESNNESRKYLFPLYFIDSVFMFFALLIFYLNDSKEARKKAVRKKHIISLYRQGFPVMLSYVTFLLYQKTDQFMLYYFGEARDLGIYSLSSRMYESLLFIVIGLTITYYPRMVKLYNNNINIVFEYYKHTLLFTKIAYCLFFMYVLLGREVLVYFIDLYFPSYHGLDEILIIHLLSLIVMYNAGMRSSYLILIKKQYILLISSIVALLLNFSLNYIFIPLYGMKGAAYVTLATQIISLIIMNFFFIQTKEIGRLQLLALSLRPLMKIKNSGE